MAATASRSCAGPLAARTRATAWLAIASGVAAVQRAGSEIDGRGGSESGVTVEETGEEEAEEVAGAEGLVTGTLATGAVTARRPAFGDARPGRTLLGAGGLGMVPDDAD
ncbi:MAG TPA: hypothetical protein VNO21_19595 [Polyangiaceae bacterium]|nr:hypothetical protein [Polyangiaceae bacterium]